MINQLVLIISVLSVIIILSLASQIVIVNKKNKDLAKELLQSRESNNEAYLKFLSDSRDWAFQYIEEVQAEITKYVNEVGPHLDYYNTYGKAVSGIHTELVNAIVPSFEELKKLLPEENKEKNK